MSEQQDRDKRVRNVFVAIVCVMLALPLPIQTVRDLLGHERVHALDVFRRPPTVENLRNYEHALERDLVAATPARRWYAEGWDRVARRGNAKVLETSDGWMYHRDELLFAAAPGMEEVHKGGSYGVDTEPNEAFDVIVDFRRQLAAQGASLVLVAVPPKATIEPEHVWRDLGPASAPNNIGLPAWLERLRAAGVEVIDLTHVLLTTKADGKAAFLQRDTHWTPEAAEAAAHVVGLTVRNMPALKGLPRNRYFRHISIAYERQPDLVGLLGYAAGDAHLPPASFVLDEILPTRDGVAPTGSLRSPILLLGDSFSVIYSDRTYGMGEYGGFPEQLAADLRAPIDVIAIPGGGANRTREMLALRGLGPKKVVIWEIAERTFLERDTAWKRITVPAALTSSTAADGPLRVRAKLVGTSRVAGDLPYGDCMVILRYEPTGPGAGPSPLFVATWGRRAFEDTAANAYEKDAVHRLTLVPLGAERALAHNCFADDVGLDRTPYWAETVEVVP